MHTCAHQKKETNLTLERSCTPDEGRSGTAPSPRSGTENKFSANASSNHEKGTKLRFSINLPSSQKEIFLPGEWEPVGNPAGGHVAAQPCTGFWAKIVLQRSCPSSIITTTTMISNIATISITVVLKTHTGTFLHCCLGSRLHLSFWTLAQTCHRRQRWPTRENVNETSIFTFLGIF